MMCIKILYPTVECQYSSVMREVQCNKQKSVTRSSTEAEIVSAGDGMVIAQFYRYILGEFGCKTNVIHYEDNMSSMSLIASGCYAYDKKENT